MRGSCLLRPWPETPPQAPQLSLIPAPAAAPGPGEGRLLPARPQPGSSVVATGPRGLLGRSTAGRRMGDPAPPLPPTAPQDTPELLHARSDLQSCRRALRRMAEDLLFLRDRVSSLEAENQLLREHQAQEDDEDSDEDLDSLRQKLRQRELDTQRLRDRVQHLQNELIRKNDREKELLNQAGRAPGALLPQHHDKLRKVKALEDTVRHQEQVIQKMEQVLNGKLRQEAQQNRLLAGSQALEAYSVLMAENARLRAELDKGTRSVPIFLQQQALPVDPGELGAEGNQAQRPRNTDARGRPQGTETLPAQDLLGSASDKLSLMAKLEQAQSRILSLESQLKDSARHWARERQELAMRIQEQGMP